MAQAPAAAPLRKEEDVSAVPGPLPYGQAPEEQAQPPQEIASDTAPFELEASPTPFEPAPSPVDFELTPGPSSFEPVPAPAYESAPSPTVEPMTKLPILAPLPSEETPVPGATAPFEEFLSKPRPTRAARPAPKPFPKRLVGGVVLLLVLAVIGFVFFGGSQPSPKPAQSGEEQAPASASLAPTMPAQPAPPPLGPTAAAPNSGPVPGYDGSDAALNLVKNYPLDGNRGTVEKWLQYSFMANPSSGNKEEWTAGAVDATTYLVQYRVLPGLQSGVKESITYLFEADISRRTVKGSNPSSRQLMAGAAAPAQSPPRRKRQAAAGSRKVKRLPQLPLPSDKQLNPRKKVKSAPRQNTDMDL